MSSVPPRGPLSDDARRAHDRHRHWVPALVIGALLLIAYLWTDLMTLFPFPGLERLAEHPVLGQAFGERGHVEARVWIHHQSGVSVHDQRCILLLLVGIGFLLAYYLPLRLKRQPLVVLTVVGFAGVTGPAGAAWLLAWHLLTFLTFHAPAPRRARTIRYLVLLSLFAWVPALGFTWPAVARYGLGVAISVPLLYAAYAYLFHPVVERPVGRALQFAMANATLLYVFLAIVWQWLPGESIFPRPVGLLLFLWQWERVVTYYLDVRDGEVPADPSLWSYLSIFLTPAALPNFAYISRIPLGYSDVANSFLRRDKNRIVLSGLWLVTLAVVYLGLRDVFTMVFKVTMFQLFGVGQPYLYSGIVAAHRAGESVGALSAWVVLVQEFLAFALMWAGYAHLKVGLWRLFGYDVPRHFNRPFLATNLVELWARYSYYYKEFLVRAFYYPVFLRFVTRHTALRVFVATFAAAGFGNFVYHVVYRALYDGVSPVSLSIPLGRVPYYIVLGSAIAVTQVFLLLRRRRRRRPWTRDWRIGLDVLGVVGTLGFFALVRPLHHVPVGSTIAEYLRIILAALGIEW